MTATPGLVSLTEYVASLNAKQIAHDTLFRDEQQRVVLVEPNYKANSEIPAGAVDAGESPWLAAARENREDLGRAHPVGSLLAVDHVPPQDNRPEGMRFVFDGGSITIGM